MIAAWLSPALAGAMLAGGPPPAAPQADEATPLAVPTVSMPSVYIEGQPFVASVTFGAGGAKVAGEIPVHLFGPAGWLMDSKVLERRSGEGAVTLRPGQEISTSIDLAPLIEARLDGDDRDFRFGFAEGNAAQVDVIHLALPPAGLDFIELPREQLDDYQVVFDTDAGLIWMELWPDVAPAHVRNFLDLCASGFYDGLEFHRVMPGFMVQGGRAREGEPAPRTLEAEFSTRPHEAGVLSAARLANDINSATSEFFIIHQASPQLDGKYSAFGKVILGMDAVDELAHAADVHDELLAAMLEKRVISAQEMDLLTKKANFDFVTNRPNPRRVLRQALVVKATKSRPTAPAKPR